MIDAVVVGAGAAGLACARALADAGLSVEVLEAQSRSGGRVHTIGHEAGVPIEAGAEFVHGRSKALWRVMNKARLRVPEIAGATHQILRGNKLESSHELFAEMHEVIRNAGDRERTVAQLLDEPELRGRDKLRAFIALYVEGFHAAPIDRASVRAIREQGEAADEATFRIADGYQRVIDTLARKLEPRLNTVVTRVRWRRGRVLCECRSQAGMKLPSIEARRAVLTLPVGAMKQLRFLPSLSTVKWRAIMGLEMGPVVKLHLRFREPIWKAPLGFLHVLDGAVPTWWTPRPFEVPMLIGWAAGPVAERLPGDERGILERAAETLTRALKIDRRRYEAALQWWHVADWRDAPFIGGAYSWIPVGHDGLQGVLGAPVENTLFFAGEATHPTQNGTVHGAIESGLRAARELVKAA